MAELYGGSKYTAKEITGVLGMIAGRLTTVQTADTLTLPCDEIVSLVLHDETTIGGARATKGTGANVNKYTITCTNDDNIDFVAFVIK